MAINFDGTNDHIEYGSDASIDNFTSKTICVWIKNSAASGFREILNKLTPASGTDGWDFVLDRTNGDILYRDVWAAFVTWTGLGTITTGIDHVAVTYDASSTSNNPIIYINNVSVSVSSDISPTGSHTSDAANNMRSGETGGGANDFNGLIGWFVYDNTILTAAEINRHYWWGTAPGGFSSSKINHPMWTDATLNKGSATATIQSIVGTTLSNLPRVERCWGSMMGCGR